MNPVRMVGGVFDAIQKAKAGAPNFCTNFFPVQAKLQNWIDHDELLNEVRDGATFFLRRDRDFWHFYFCAASPTALQREITASPSFKTERVVTDVVGSDAALGGLLETLEPTGFRRYARLQRMARAGLAGRAPSVAGDLQAVLAETADCAAVLDLIENSFDRFGEQLPMLYEIEAAVENRQVLVVKNDESIAGLLFFETQGFASAVRFWVVAEKFRALRVGSALMKHYLKTQSTVRRFTLWVNANNENAIQKYRHYGYAPEGLVDHILVNEMIRS